MYKCTKGPVLKYHSGTLFTSSYMFIKVKTKHNDLISMTIEGQILKSNAVGFQFSLSVAALSFHLFFFMFTDVKAVLHFS